jgi:predicted MFS family arabinose efflux permease
LRGLSLIALPFTGFSVVGLSAFAVFYGLDWVATVPPTVRLTAERFGPEKANLTFGWIFTAHMLGAAAAALGGGISRTEFATYLPSLYTAGVACVIAAALVLTIGSRRKEALAAA